jgi:hypothetical protein
LVKQKKNINLFMVNRIPCRGCCKICDIPFSIPWTYRKTFIQRTQRKRVIGIFLFEKSVKKMLTSFLVNDILCMTRKLVIMINKLVNLGWRDKNE